MTNKHYPLSFNVGIHLHDTMAEKLDAIKTARLLIQVHLNPLLTGSYLAAEAAPASRLVVGSSRARMPQFKQNVSVT